MISCHTLVSEAAGEGRYPPPAPTPAPQLGESCPLEQVHMLGREQKPSPQEFLQMAAERESTGSFVAGRVQPPDVVFIGDVSVCAPPHLIKLLELSSVHDGVAASLKGSRCCLERNFWNNRNNSHKTNVSFPSFQ